MGSRIVMKSIAGLKKIAEKLLFSEKHDGNELGENDEVKQK